MALTPNPIDPSSSGNPIIDQINSIRQPSDLQGLSQPAKDVLTSVHQKLLQGQGLPAALSQAPQPAAPVPMTRPAPAQPLNLSALAKPAAGPTPMMPQHPLTSAPMNPNVQGAEDEVNRLNSTGSGVSQIKNPWGRIPLQILDAVGGSFFPKISALLPGTELHHERLANEAEGNLKNQEGLESEQATNAEHAAQTESLKNPKDEITPISTDKGYVGVSKHTGEAKPIEVNGEQAQPVEKPDKTIAPHYTTTGDGSVLAITTDPSTGKHTTETVYQGTAKEQPKAVPLEVNGKQHTVIVDEKTGKTIKDLGETGEKTPTVNVNPGTWTLEEDKDGKPVLFNSKTGEKKDAEGVQKSGTSAKASAAHEKETAPVQGALDYAQDYLKRGVFTGPGDEALQEKFFELAKPSTGFRMSQPQITQLQDSRSWMNSVKGKLYHATTGQWFPPEQRQQMVDTMNQLAQSKLKATGGSAGGTVDPDVKAYADAHFGGDVGKAQAAITQQEKSKQ